MFQGNLVWHFAVVALPGSTRISPPFCEPFCARRARQLGYTLWVRTIVRVRVRVWVSDDVIRVNNLCLAVQISATPMFVYCIAKLYMWIAVITHAEQRFWHTTSEDKQHSFWILSHDNTKVLCLFGIGKYTILSILETQADQKIYSCRRGGEKNSKFPFLLFAYFSTCNS